jgi:hypothetical protein
METTGAAKNWTAEIILVALIVGWILYELYGRTALSWLSEWSSYIRMVGGSLVIVYLWWQLKDRPEEFKDTLSAAKDLLAHTGYVSGSYSSSATASTKEKRNVTGLMKKTVAAEQKWKCGACGDLLDEAYEVDHIVPLWANGSNDRDNLVALHAGCHAKKTMKERLDEQYKK